MTSTKAKVSGEIGDTETSRPHPGKIDLTAPAGNQDSLGEESIRDGRPATDDSIVEAIDEEMPAIPAAPPR